MKAETSEFNIDPERICRAKGHSFVNKPHPRSSYYDKPRTEKYCSRCNKWIDDGRTNS